MMNEIKQEALVALTEYDIRVLSAEGLVELRSFSNNVWKVVDKNKSYILRRYSRIPFEKLVRMNTNINCLIKLGIPIPKIIKNTNDSYATSILNYSYDLSEFVPHVELKYPEMNITDDQIIQAADLLAKIHNIPVSHLPFPLENKSTTEVDFQYIQKLISDFQSTFQELLIQANQVERKKLYNLRELLLLTNSNRKDFIDLGGLSLNHLPMSLSQGDFSLSNLLPALQDNKIYIIDWENMGLRTRAWEFHRSLLLICGIGYCNANFDELDFNRAELFVKHYLGKVEFSTEEYSLLPRIAEYIAFFHWIRFTIESILRKDNRILERIPEDIEKGLWWKMNSNKYSYWIQNFSK